MAKRKWPGVFLDEEPIDLTPEHLITCGSPIENLKEIAIEDGEEAARKFLDHEAK